MSKILVVALSGWKQSGKDTVANYLTKCHNFTRVAFADSLKDLVAQEYDIPRNYLDDPKHKEMPLLKYAVFPKDKFSRLIAEFMVREFVDKDGNKPKNYTYTDEADFKGEFITESGIEARTLYHCPRSLAILKGSTNRTVHSNFWVHAVVNKIAFNDYPLKSNVMCYVIPDLRYKSEVEGLKTFLGPESLVTVRINRYNNISSVDPSERDLDDYTFDYVLTNKGTVADLEKAAEKLLQSL
jgi:hypothetical protein